MCVSILQQIVVCLLWSVTVNFHNLFLFMLTVICFSVSILYIYTYYNKYCYMCYKIIQIESVRFKLGSVDNVVNVAKEVAFVSVYGLLER